MTFPLRTLFCCLALALCLLAISPVHAQGTTTPPAAGGVSYKTYYTQGEITMQVFLISSTGSTGIYEIGKDTRLLELITLAGFAPPVRNERNVVRNTISVIRPRQSNEPIYEARIERLVMEPERHPPLEDGDMILIESVQKTRFTWREVVSFVSGVSSVLLLAGRLGLVNFRR